MTVLPAGSAPLKARWCIVLITAAIVAAYHNSLHGPLVFDDASSIVGNPSIRQLWPVTKVLAGPAANTTAQGRPILNLSLAINYAIGGTAVESYHIGNLLIHLAAALTLFGVIRRTPLPSCGSARDPVAAPAVSSLLPFWVAVLWAVHPLQTESVTYVIQRAESLAGLFYLLTFYCFVRSMDCRSPTGSRRGEGLWQMASVVACLLGMATKEIVVTAPLLLLFFDRTFFSGSFFAAWCRRRAFYLALASTWLLLARLVLQTGGNRGGSIGFGVGVSWWEYWLTQFKAIAHYLWLSVWPQSLIFEYGVYWIRTFGEIGGPVVLVGVLLTAIIVALRRRSAVGFAGAWFFGILAPTSLAPGTTQMIVEHRMYLPLVAVIATGVAGAHVALARRQHVIQPMLGLAAIALALLTVRRNETYRSDVVLWRDTIAKRPNNPLAHIMLAGAYEHAGDSAAALASYERTIALKPDFSIAHERLAELLIRQGRRAEAIAHFRYVLRGHTDFADAHANLGKALFAEGWLVEAVSHLETAARLAPESAMTHYDLGNALAEARLPLKAATEYELALRLKPGWPEAHFNLANTLVELGKPKEAIAQYEAAMRARPDYPAAHYNLANALAALGQRQEAVVHYQAALRSRPDYAEAHHNLGSALFELGWLAQAAEEFEETLRLAPNFPHARENLQQVRRQMGRSHP